MSVLHLLASSPRTPAATLFWKAVQEELASGKPVSAYLLHEGATALLDSRLSKLIPLGLRLFACPRAVETFAPKHNLEIVLGGPGLLAELVERCSLTHSYNPE